MRLSLINLLQGNNLIYMGRMIFEGLLSYIPGFSEFGLNGKVITDYRLPASYYYSVWLRHLVMLYKNGMKSIPSSIAELGPGQSLGTGIAALLSGASSYYALDVVKFASTAANIEMFQEMIKFFKDRMDIPDNNEFPSLEPLLKTYEFPGHIFTDELLREALSDKRLSSIKDAIINQGSNENDGIYISYMVPWNDPGIIRKNSIDLLLSQAVLEHVDSLRAAYQSIYHWLKPGGIMSHSIDFRSHGLAAEWNGQWTYSGFTWKLIKGNRPYLLNRQPHSAHLDIIKKMGYKLLCDYPTYRKSKIKRKNLASDFQWLSENDLNTRTTFLQALKK